MRCSNDHFAKSNTVEGLSVLVDRGSIKSWADLATYYRTSRVLTLISYVNCCSQDGVFDIYIDSAFDLKRYSYQVAVSAYFLVV